MDFIDLSAQQKVIKEQIDKRIQDVLKHGKYILGPEVFKLEENLKSYVGVRHCISCSSGTDALLIPLMAKGIGPGDAVITTPFSFMATAEVIALLGATPVFCDIYPETFNLNPDLLEQAFDTAIKKGLKPKAILPVNLFGLPARYRLIKEFAKEKKLFILEDAAQGFGGIIGDKKACSFGDVSSTSFFPAKPLGCYGDGGAIFTNDDELAKRMISIRMHGSGIDQYDNIRIGINGRLDTLQAAILIEKLKLFDLELNNRNRIADIYTKNINEKYKKGYIPNNYKSSWAQYSILTKNGNQRDKAIEHLNSSTIPAMIYYKTPLHLMKAFKSLNYKIGDFINSENISTRIFSIPFHPYLSENDQNLIIETLNSF